MALTLEVNGTEFGNFTSASASIAIDQAVNLFHFSATSEDPQDFPVAVGDEVAVLADGFTIITGFVMDLRGSHSERGRTIEINGASKTVDAIDSQINAINFSTPISLEDVIKRILDDIGLDISITNEVDDLKDFEKSEIITAEPGQGAFDLMEQYARKRQVFIRADTDGNFLISRNSGNDSGFKLTSRIKDNENNVKSASVTIDHNFRFNSYIARSQQNMVGLALIDEDPGAESVSNQFGQATDDNIRAGRSFVFVSENADNNDNLNERAIWEANIRRSDSFIYQAEVPEHTFQDEIWAVNSLVQVEDEWEGVNGSLLIRALEFRFSLQGSTTKIFCVTPDAYTLEASEPQKQEQTNDLAGIFGG